MNPESRFKGCLLGGAIGDALGAPVEFLSLQLIRSQYGPDGITQYAPAYGRCGSITDDTQMTLFTADGLLRAEAKKRSGKPEDIVAAVHEAYLRWLLTQRDASSHKVFPEATRREMLGWLYRLPPLRSRRAPGTTCIMGLRSEVMGTMERPINSSKGCGGLMRVTPVGLFFDDAVTAFEMGCRIAAITHGHPSGYLAAGTCAAVIRLLLDGQTLEASLDRAVELLKKKQGYEECVSAVGKARAAAVAGKPSPEAVEQFGAGWVAEEALAIGIYCTLVSKNDFRNGVLLAVNHGGDSDSTGAIAGSLLGSMMGVESIPMEWLAGLEIHEAIEQVAGDLWSRHREEPEWGSRYPV
jgi:ADP-ribosylglycohydrolase